jgi:predicted subunit of tRNA(5-methylaminomethyl-2-thiouridylate) methyltransferase
MSLTNSEIVEEILFEAHKLGINREVMDSAKNMILRGTPPADAYENAFREIIQHIETEKVNL